MTIFSRISLAVLAAITTCGTTASLAAFPERPVEFVISTAPGGGHDAYVRAVAARLQEKWGKPVIVLNKPGASVTIAEGYVANAAPDGYTVLFVNSQRTINAATASTDSGYDMVNGLAPITQVGKQPQIIVVKNELPAKTLPDLVQFAKANPNKLNYGDNGPGSGADLAMKLLMRKTGTELFEISYKAQPEVLIAMLNGEVDVSFGNVLSLTAQIKAGKVRALAITDDVRSPVFPDLPTAKEALGLDSFVYTSWYGVFVPAKTPRDIVEKLNQDIVATLNLPEVKDPLIRDGLQVIASKPDEFEKVIKEEVAGWRSVMAKWAKGICNWLAKAAECRRP